MSIPFFGKEFTLTQPDGSQLPVRGWGDQYHAVFETLDGFTVVEDPVSGFYHYARVSEGGEELRPSGIRAGAVDPLDVGIARNLRASPEGMRAQAEIGRGLPRRKTRWEKRREEAKSNRLSAIAAAAVGVAAAPPQQETVGDYVGLCLLIQFPDVPGTISPTEVEAFCNQPGYNGFGNHGSVRDYFQDNSGGRLRYSNIVAPYYTASHPKSYYDNLNVPYPNRARELITEALTSLKAGGFDFSGLTSDNQGYVYALNVFYAGHTIPHWSKGLWPHSSSLLTPFQLSPGKQAYDYQITDMGSQLTLATFCHENGHMVCDFPDLYDYGNQSFGAGVYCLMCVGGNADPKNPAQVGAYLKYRAGWADSLTPITSGLNGTIAAGRNEFFLHAKSPTEYFILENRLRAGRDQALPGSGLAVWHIDELGSNNNEQMTAASHYECSLVQADGAFNLERKINTGDAADLFRSGGVSRFADSTSPNSRWWDGTASNLDVHDIGASGPVMTFSASI